MALSLRFAQRRLSVDIRCFIATLSAAATGLFLIGRKKAEQALFGSVENGGRE